MPSALLRSVAAAIVASLVACPRINSTSVISGTGFMKCIPSTRSGRLVAAPISVMEMDDVFEARITSGRASASRRPKSVRLRLHGLDDGFDDVVCRRQLGKPRRDLEPAERLIAVGCGELAFLDELAQRLLDAGARAIERARLEIVQQHGVAGLREYLRDARRPSSPSR